MAESTEIRWKRSTTEAAVIVVSILLAFSIDAWWQDHVEDEREREVLIALLDDFRNTRENIRDWRNFHLAVQASTKELLQAVTAGDQTLAEEEVERLLGDLGWWDSQSHFSTGALYSLVYGDELSIIEDSALRQMLADWPSKIEHVGVVQGQDYDFFLSVWTPYMRANAYLPQLATNDSPMPGRPKHISSVLDLQLDARRSYADLIAKDEFHNLLVQKSWIQFDVLVAFDEIERLLDRTIQRIEGQL